MISRKLEGVIAEKVEEMLDDIRNSKQYETEVSWWWPDHGDDLIIRIVINAIDLIVDSSEFTEEQSR